MNIFQDVPSVMFIENENDVNFVKDFLTKNKTNYDNAYGDISKIKIGDILIKQNQFYIVKPLDTLESISKKFNVTIEHIKSKNDIKNLYIGQKLEI